MLEPFKCMKCDADLTRKAAQFQIPLNERELVISSDAMVCEQCGSVFVDFPLMKAVYDKACEEYSRLSAVDFIQDLMRGRENDDQEGEA